MIDSKKWTDGRNYYDYVSLEQASSANRIGSSVWKGEYLLSIQ